MPEDEKECLNGCSLAQQNLTNILELKEYDVDCTKQLFRTFNLIMQNREVLQDHLKSHIVVAREQLTDKDKLTIFREFDEAIEKQLDKLEGKDGEKSVEQNIREGVPPVIESQGDVRHLRAVENQSLTNSKPSEPCPICDGTGINIHMERDNTGILNREVEYPCQCQKEPTEVYDINEIREYVKTKGYFLVIMADLEKFFSLL